MWNGQACNRFIFTEIHFQAQLLQWIIRLGIFVSWPIKGSLNTVKSLSLLYFYRYYTFFLKQVFTFLCNIWNHLHIKFTIFQFDLLLWQTYKLFWMYLLVFKHQKWVTSNRICRIHSQVFTSIIPEKNQIKFNYKICILFFNLSLVVNSRYDYIEFI